MKSLASRTAIQAVPEAVWRILVEAPGHPGWNTTVARIEGHVAQGARVTAHAKVAPGRTLPVKVVAFVASRRIVWGGGMPLGLFEGKRALELRPAAGGGVDFAMRGDDSGWLAPPITKSIPDLQPAFDEFAACL